MYILDPLYYLYKKNKRKDLIAVASRISQQQNISRFKIIIDMIGCALKYGAIWGEYGDLNFYFRSPENRNTYITTFYNFKLYDKINKKEYRNLFHEKVQFLDKFSEFIKRAWICTDGLSDEEVKAFLAKHKNVVAKASYGDSGKQVEVINITENDDLDEILAHIKEQNFNLIEEQIYNHTKLKKLNPTSLNTMRIVTVRNDFGVTLLFAGVRAGRGEDAKIDNFSQGGKMAGIDIETGKINSPFFVKLSACESRQEQFLEDSEEDFYIPCWEAAVETVKKAAEVVPQIGIVAWDVAVTESGEIDIIEGNESFCSVVMQVARGNDEEGLKPALKSILEGKVYE